MRWGGARVFRRSASLAKRCMIDIVKWLSGGDTSTVPLSPRHLGNVHFGGCTCIGLSCGCRGFVHAASRTPACASTKMHIAQVSRGKRVATGTTTRQPHDKMSIPVCTCIGLCPSTAATATAVLTRNKSAQFVLSKPHYSLNRPRRHLPPPGSREYHPLPLLLLRQPDRQGRESTTPYLCCS